MNYQNSKHHRTRSKLPRQRGLTAQPVDEYLRDRDLPRLIAVWPREVADPSQAGILILIRKLKNALRAERQRGRSGHWSYDLGRHIRLVKALKAEMTMLALGQERKVSSLK